MAIPTSIFKVNIISHVFVNTILRLWARGDNSAQQNIKKSIEIVDVAEILEMCFRIL